MHGLFDESFGGFALIFFFRDLIKILMFSSQFSGVTDNRNNRNRQ